MTDAVYRRCRPRRSLLRARPRIRGRFQLIRSVTQTGDDEKATVAYHYCKNLNDDINQCVLYDGTGPDAKLIGIEYLVTDAVYQKMPAEEKAFWHDHKYEVDAGLIRSLTQSGDDEKATLAKVRTLWGKVFHTWVSGTDLSHAARPACSGR